MLLVLRGQCHATTYVRLTLPFFDCDDANERVQRKLRRLCADRNYLTGRLPSELGQLTSLEKLDLALNDASAERPDKIGLTGCIPSTLRNLRCLESLELHGNRLTGYVRRDGTPG